MLILALDTTTRAGSVAVTRDDTVLALVQGDGSRTHGERLPGEIAHALAGAAVPKQALDLLVVASGPGAFTGLRIGLAAVQGLAMVLGVPVVGVSALDATAEAVWHEVGRRRAPGLVVWMDAQRGEVFEAQYVAETPGAALPWRLAGDATVGPPDEALARLPAAWQSAAFAGDGALRYRAAIDQRTPGLSPLIDLPPALAPALARVGRRRAQAGAAGPPHALQPLYVRRPDAELDRLRRVAP